MLLWFAKHSGIRGWVLTWCQTRKTVICYVLVLVKLKETHFSEVIQRFLIEISVERFLVVATLEVITL